VWQITQQHPREFEFNESFLLFLVDQVYAQQFGTFLANSERHRDALRLKTRTTSIWSFVNHPAQRPTWLNPLYRPSGEKMLPVSAAPGRVQLWQNLYNRSEMPSPSDLHTALSEEIVQLKSELQALKEQRNAETGSPPPN
jgi:hypothetical protein